jgi:hypothetical protein
MKKAGIYIGLLCGLINSAGALAAPPGPASSGIGKPAEPRAAATSADGNYRLGDRLQQSKAPKADQPADSEFKEVTWEALVPKDWDPMKAFKGLDLNAMSDADPRAMDMLQKLREAWDNAPVERSMNGARIRIPGFIVPLDTQRGQIKEFLLVPYFGGCIHSPPPPANQIISVVSPKPLKMQTMDAVWISGVLETARSDTSMGNSGYRMKAVAVTPYVPPKSK